jgi:hypothetical protein
MYIYVLLSSTLGCLVTTNASFWLGYCVVEWHGMMEFFKQLSQKFLQQPKLSPSV